MPEEISEFSLKLNLSLLIIQFRGPCQKLLILNFYDSTKAIDRVSHFQLMTKVLTCVIPDALLLSYKYFPLQPTPSNFRGPSVLAYRSWNRGNLQDKALGRVIFILHISIVFTSMYLLARDDEMVYEFQLHELNSTLPKTTNDLKRPSRR